MWKEVLIIFWVSKVDLAISHVQQMSLGTEHDQKLMNWYIGAMELQVILVSLLYHRCNQLSHSVYIIMPEFVFRYTVRK
jgi:hypothetical protein